MVPNRSLARYLCETRSLLVREINASELTEDARIRALEYAHAIWLTCIRFMHKHKPSMARGLAVAYEEYKAKCKEANVLPLPPWLFDYEQCIFLIDVDVLPREQYRLEPRANIKFAIPKSGIAELIVSDTGE